ncbi:MAG: SUMF1/EgtB/PvdO family nonheme iron enzyme [Nitrospira sp.]|nr:SUMF1/EgtB/PvdO family nonheme iron enzyme [Nitrospira sp.]
MSDRIAPSTISFSPNASQVLGLVTGTVFLICCVVSAESAAKETHDPAPPPELEQHLAAIAGLAQPSPMVKIPAGWFLMGTMRKDDDPFGLETQYDDTEFPQRRIWLDAYALDRDEVSLAEYLAFLYGQGLPVPLKLRHLIWHLIDVHVLLDYVMARWPALYVTWEEADRFCRERGKRLPTEAEWEKGARGTDGRVFPWGADPPTPDLAVSGLYHVHQIPLVVAVDSFEEGRSPYGLHHMAGNVREWVHDWFGPDSYSLMPERNPRGSEAGRYKSVRGGSWRSRPQLLRTATRNGATPATRSPNIGFRCARTLSSNPDEEIVDEANPADPDRAE